MEIEIAEEDMLFREQVRSWLQEHKPKEPRPSDEGEGILFDRAWQKVQFDHGWAGISWPVEYGGRSLSLSRQLIWFEEYGDAEAPWSGTLVVGLNHGGPTLIKYGTEEQKSFHLPKILSGESLWCQGFSEPNAGSDLAALSLSGRIDGDALVVSGQKVWTSFAQHADYQELLVRTDPGSHRHAGISWLICDMRTPGITVRPIRTITNDYHFAEVFYDEVRIPLSNLVGDLNDGWQIAMSTLGFERGTGSILGQMRLQKHLRHLTAIAEETNGWNGRRQIQQDQVRTKLASLQAEIFALRSMIYATVSRNQDKVPGPESSMLGLYFSQLNKELHSFAMDLLGPESLNMNEDHSWAWHYLDTYKYTISGGTSQVRKNIIGERVLGLPR
jgi:alkylation response protein AidB-like acyl-CoA dehydrogenase